MNIRIIPHRSDNAAWSLALEEALFLKAKQDLLNGKEIQPIIKMYSFSRPSVILGYMQNISEINYEYCKEHNVDVTMRTTGGGSVYLGKKDLQYSLLLNQPHSKELLKKINTSIVKAIQDIGLTPKLKLKNDSPVIRLDNKGFVFDAQRRFKNLLLHHGTTLVDNYDYKHMPKALRASREEKKILKTGNIWLAQKQEISGHNLIRAFERNLPENISPRREDYTNEEIALARKLYQKFYINKESISSGKKEFGICYKTNTKYNMEDYAEEDKDG